MFTLIGSRARKHEKVSQSTIFLIVFLFTLHFTPSIYINSAFLSGLFSESSVGIIYALASIGAIATILLTRKLLPRLGNFKMFINILILEAIALIGMIFGTSQTIVATGFILHFIATAVAFMHADIFLESEAKDENTGTTRGFSLTCLNIAFVLGPIISSLLARNGDYWKIYSMGLILLIPVIIYSVLSLQNFKDPEYNKESFFSQAKRIIHNRDIFFALLCAFMLRVFFSWMVIYSPIYLINNIGFDLNQVTLIIGIGLIPFVLLEYVLGRIADKYIGEKEMMSIGFVILALSTASIVFAPQIPLFWLWAGIIFVTRIGASIVEVMTEVYLFKKINVTDINTLSFFRTLQPAAYVIAPLVGSFALLIFDDIRYLFMILAIYLLFGLRYSLALNDTK